MEIHKPKPVHSWREFVTEIGVIMIGVLLALGAEQTVETLRHEAQVEVGEKALQANFTQFIRQRGELTALTPCIDQRLAEVRAILDDGARRHRLGAVGLIPQPPPHSWEIPNWDTMVSSQAATHVSQEQVVRLARISHWAHDAAVSNADETDLWSVLNSLTGAPRQFSEAEEASLRASLARAQHQSVLLRDITETTEAAILETGLLTRAAVAAAKAAGSRQESVRTMCAPIRYVPAKA